MRDVQGKKAVFIVFKDRAKVREVNVIATQSDGYLVEGLTGGEDVILRPPATLKDGDKVRLKAAAQ